MGTVGGVKGRYREEIWRLTEVQKDRERWKVKLPGVCQQHVTGVGVHYSTGFTYSVSLPISLSPCSACMICGVCKKSKNKVFVVALVPFFVQSLSVYVSVSRFFCNIFSLTYLLE